MGEIDRFEDALFPEEAEPREFTIDSLEKAEWAMSKIARAEERIQRFMAIAQAAKARIDTRLDAITGVDRDTVDRMGAMIRPWAEVEIATNGKRRSIDLLNGRVGFRQSPARLEVTDEMVALAVLPETCIRVKREVDKIATKKLIESKGEIPDGIELVPGKVNFYVEAERPEIEKKEETHGLHS